MLKTVRLDTRPTRNLIVMTVLLLLAVGILVSGLFVPVQAATPAQGQNATPTPDSMQHGGIMGQGMSMAQMGVFMDQMMAHMYSMMGIMPMSGSMPMTGTMPMSGTMPMTGMMDPGMMQMCEMMHMNSSMAMTGTMPMMGVMPMSDTMPMAGSMPMSGTMPMAGTTPMEGMMSMEHMGMMMQMMGMMQMQMGCMQMTMGAMMSQGMMGEGMMGNGTMGESSGMEMPSDVAFDAMFIDSMIEHHQGAIDMAEMAREQAEHEEIRTLAEEIIAAQAAEIDQMQSWRSEWYPDLAPTGGMQMGMGEMMIREDESVPFDQRFIEAMIEHHQGAIDMAEMALEQAEHEEIRTLAEAIIAAQETEIEQMEGWLEEWYDGNATSSLIPSPYATQLATPVRGLTIEEVDDLLNGRGMGFARMAELNNYPGPRHLLDLQEELALTPEQIAQIELLFQTMQADAQILGREIVRQEQVLSEAFATDTVDSTALNAQVGLLADYYGQLRVIHLQTHLEVTPILTNEQITQYNHLRGYTDQTQDIHSH